MRKWGGEDMILSLLADGEPRTPNESSVKLGINQKTAQRVMMELAVDGRLRHKRFGRYHIFWRLDALSAGVRGPSR